MPSLLETLESINWCGLECVYELFAVTYHMALDHEEELISILEVDQDTKIARDVAGLSFEQPDKPFCPQALSDYRQSSVRSDREALLFVAALLPRLDGYLAGMETLAEGASQAPNANDALLRLKNANYYSPIHVDVAGAKATYVIAPRIRPLFSKWQRNVLDYDETYFSATLSYHFLEHHTIVKDGKVNNHSVILSPGHTSPARSSSFHHTLAGLDTLTIALAPLDAGFSFDAETYRRREGSTKVPFRYVGIKHPGRDEMGQYVERILAAAQGQGVDILVFPELTIDHNALTAMVDYLSRHNEPNQLKLVVAGSFHKERYRAGYVNMATMLDWQGNLIWEHSKKRPFVLTSETIEKSPNRDAIRTAFKLEPDDELVEYIHTENPLVFIDTPIGRMATVICLDMLLPSVESIISRIPCDFLWVPAMTLSIDRFQSKARDIYGGQFNAVTACCASISCCTLFKGEASSFSFVYAPSKKFKNNAETLSKVIRIDDPPLLIYKLHELM